MRNADVMQRIRVADFRGESLLERKPLYIEQNCFDVDLDEPIFRIFQWTHLTKDIENGELTFVHANPETWGDDYENPLLKARYIDAATGSSFGLEGLVGDYHALCWAKSQTVDSWGKFSHGKSAVRLGTTPRILLDRLMSVEDEWFMLRFHIGLVQYKEMDEIDKWIAGDDYAVHLDSLGQELAASLMLLRSFFSAEEEVRLLMSPCENSPNEWSKRSIQSGNGTISVPFDWAGTVQSVEYGALVSDAERRQFEQLIASRNVLRARST